MIVPEDPLLAVARRRQAYRYARGTSTRANDLAIANNLVQEIATLLGLDFEYETQLYSEACNRTYYFYQNLQAAVRIGCSPATGQYLVVCNHDWMLDDNLGDLWSIALRPFDSHLATKAQPTPLQAEGPEGLDTNDAIVLCGRLGVPLVRERLPVRLRHAYDLLVAYTNEEHLVRGHDAYGLWVQLDLGVGENVAG